MNKEELKDRVTSELDPIQFLDIVGVYFDELFDIVWEELSEEQRQELQRAFD